MKMMQSQEKTLRLREKRNRQKMKNLEKTHYNENQNGQNHILVIGVCVIFMGVFLILVSIIVSTAYIPYIPEAQVIKIKIWSVIDNLLMCLGTTVMTIGAGTALYSYFDFVNYMQDKMKRVMLEYEFTDILSDDEKKKLATKLEKEIVQQTDGNNLYDFVQDEVLSLAQQVFYEKHIINIACSRSGDTISKTIHKSYVMNCTQQPDFDILAANQFVISHKNKDIDIAEEIKLSINGVIFTKTDYDINEEKSNDEVYNKQSVYTLNDKAREKIKQITNKEDWNYLYEVESEIVSVVQDNDLTFSYRLYYPCKETMILFTYHPKEFEVMENIFVFKDTDISNTVDKPVKVIHNNGSILIQIHNWILPGDGVVFILAPVEMKEK